MTETAPAEKRDLDREARSFVGWITAGHVAVHWYQQLFPVVTPTIKAALGLNDVEVGLLSSARVLSSGFLNLPAGMLSDARPLLRPVLLAGAVVVMGLSFTIAGVLPTFAWLVVASLLGGLGSAIWHPISLSALSHRYPDRRGTMLSVHGTGATVGDTVTPLIAGAVLAIVAWQGFLAFQILPAVLVGLALARVLTPQFRALVSEHDEPLTFLRRSRDMAVLMRSAPFIVLTAATTFWAVSRAVVLTFLPIYLQEDLGYSTVVLGFYIALLHVLGIVSQTVLGVLSDRFGRKPVLVPSFAILGLLYIALAYAPPGVALGLVVAAIGIFFYTLANVVTAAVFDTVDRRIQASAQGLQTVLTQVLVLPSPVIAGIMIGAYGIASVFVTSGLLVLLGAILMVPIKMRGRS